MLCSLRIATSQLPGTAKVVTRLELAALCVRWSPCARKFAIGAARTVCVAYRDGDKSWWVAKLMRRCHSSSVVAVAWHPSGALLATASSDGHCCVFSARIAGALAGVSLGSHCKSLRRRATCWLPQPTRSVLPLPRLPVPLPVPGACGSCSVCQCWQRRQPGYQRSLLRRTS